MLAWMVEANGVDLAALDKDWARHDGTCFDTSHVEELSVLRDRLRQWNAWKRTHDCERTIRDRRNQVAQLQQGQGVHISRITHLEARLEELTGKRPA